MKISETMMEQFRQGDLLSFYQDVYPSLLRYSTRVLGDVHDHLAEDCVQEAIYKVYQKRDRFTNPTEMKAYLFMAVHNEIVDVFRKGERHEQYLKHKEWKEDNPIDSFLMQETLDLLYEAISQLPDELRTIYELVYEQHMKASDIAQRLNISTTTVARQKARLVEALRRYFRDNGLMQLLISALFSDILT